MNGSGRATTLVIEDDAMNRRCLVRLLQHTGHSVESASTVAAALGRLSSQTRIVLLDINLPDGSGEQILAHIRRKSLSARVAVLTGSADPATLERLRHLKADAVFIKPCHPERLLQWAQEARSGPPKLDGDETAGTPSAS